MTTSLTIRSTIATFVAALALMLMWSNVAFASEVTGTLNSGVAATSTISGTVVSGTTQCSDGIDNDADGTIDMQDPACDLPTQDDESNDPGGASNHRNSGGSSNNNNDDDDDGEVLGADTSTGVGGSGDVLGVPGVPNTGAGTDMRTLATLLGSLGAMAAGVLTLRRYSRLS